MNKLEVLQNAKQLVAQIRLEKDSLKARVILQVHDELIVEAPENEAEKAAAILSEEMQNAVNLSVPLIADAGIGKTWYEAKT